MTTKNAQQHVVARMRDPTLASLRTGAPYSPMADSRDIKTEARQLVDGLPETATWDDLAYEVYVRASIDAGLTDADAGRTVSTDEALARVRARIRRASQALPVDGPFAGPSTPWRSSQRLPNTSVSTHPSTPSSSSIVWWRVSNKHGRFPNLGASSPKSPALRSASSSTHRIA